MQAVPAAVQAYGQYKQGQDSATALSQQAQTVRTQAYADEATQRRQSSQILGKQAAAMAQAGGGIDEGLIRQSAANAELDALNIRYAGLLRGSTLATQGANAKSSAGLLAGGTILRGVSQGYTRQRALQLQQQGGGGDY